MRRTASDFPPVIVLIIFNTCSCSFCLFSKWTALHYSSRNNDLDISRLLVEWKADVAARDKCRSPSRASQSFSHSLRCSDGRTALKRAIDWDKADIAEYLCSIDAPQ